MYSACATVSPNKRHKQSLSAADKNMANNNIQLSLLQRKKLRSYSVNCNTSELNHNNNDNGVGASSVPSFPPVQTQSLPLSIDTVNLTYNIPTTSNSAHVYSTNNHTNNNIQSLSPHTCSPKLLQRRSSLSSGTIKSLHNKSTVPHHNKSYTNTNNSHTSLLHNASLSYVTADVLALDESSTGIYDENSHLPVSQSNESIDSVNILTTRDTINDDTVVHGNDISTSMPSNVELDVEMRRTTLSQHRRSNSPMLISAHTPPIHINDNTKELCVSTVIDDTIIDDTTSSTTPPLAHYHTPPQQLSPTHHRTSSTAQHTPSTTNLQRSARKTLNHEINQRLSNLNNNIAPEYSMRLQSPGHTRRNTLYNTNTNKKSTAQQSPFLSRTNSRLTSPLHGRSPVVSRPGSPTRHSMISPRATMQQSLPGSPTSIQRRTTDRRLFDSSVLSKPSPKRALNFDVHINDTMSNNSSTANESQSSTQSILPSPTPQHHTISDTNSIQPMRSLNHSSLYQTTHTDADRFIPSRTTSLLDTARAESPPKQTQSSTNSNTYDQSNPHNDSKDAHYTATYSTLLKNELFGGNITGTSSRRNSGNNHVRISLSHNDVHALQSSSGSTTPTHRRHGVNQSTPTSVGINAATNKIRTFSFRSPNKSTSMNNLHDAFNQSLVSKQSERLLQQRTTPPRKIQRTAYRVLDAPQLKDDYYLNLVDWSETNCIGVALGSSVYIWNANTSRVTKLLQLSDTNHVCSVQWSRTGKHLAVGTKQGTVHLWDVQTQQLVRAYDGHTSRVSTLAFNYNMLASGSRDRNIVIRDARMSDNGGTTSILRGHKQEVCGLKWSPDDQQLASGGNDNRLYIWSNKNYHKPQYKFCDHRGAVKAIAWSPHQPGLLCSGGGTADKHIRFWNTLPDSHTTINTHTNNPLSPLSPNTPDLYNQSLSDINEQSSSRALYSIDTGSQVCQLAWSSTCNEIVSTHGYSLNQIIVWKYNNNTHYDQPVLTPISTLTGHSMRVLYLAVSPDGQSIVTGAGDETLRFWNIFPAKDNDDSQLGSPLKLPNMQSIR